MPGNEVKLWFVPELGGIHLLSGRYFDYSFAPHSHDAFVVAVVSGRMRVALRGSHYESSRDELAILRPGVVHSGDSDGAWVIRSMDIEPTSLERVVMQMGIANGMPEFPSAPVRDPALVELFVRTHRIMETSRDPIERESSLLEMLAELVARHGRRSPTLPAGREPRAVWHAQEYLRANSSRNVSLQTLSEVVGLSPYYLTRAFHRQVGMPPHAYLLQLRIARAKKLLAVGVPIAQVALDCGFADQSHLYRHFKRIVGVPPGRLVLGNSRGSNRRERR